MQLGGGEIFAERMGELVTWILEAGVGYGRGTEEYALGLGRLGKDHGEGDHRQHAEKGDQGRAPVSASTTKPANPTPLAWAPAPTS